MAAPHDLCWNPPFSCQMICKQNIGLNHMFFRYESNLEIRTHYIDKHWVLSELNLSMLKSNSLSGNNEPFFHEKSKTLQTQSN